MDSYLNFIRRYWYFLPLLCFSPIGNFLGSYLEGAEMLSKKLAFYISAISLFILPFVVSFLLIFIIKAKWFVRVLLFGCFLIAQFFLQFMVPAGATAEMMGIAYHLGQEFQPNLIRECADQLRQKKIAHTLKVIPRGTYTDCLIDQNAQFVDESELPNALHGRFVRVYIRPSFTAQDYKSSDDVVVFALDWNKGIYCNDRKYMSCFNVYSIADGVHAYRFQRQ